MDNSNKHHGFSLRRRVRRRADRHGKITLVTIFAILGMIVLAGFVGNAGHVVTNKVASQNAADAIAFSSAQWMARGMNAVTATNHLLGETTALVVLIEALGGPEADEGMVDYPPQSSVPDSVNRTLAGMAFIQGLPMYGTNFTGQLDKKFLNAVINKLIAKEGDDAKHHAFATIYDSKLVLKRATTKRLIAKFVANWLLYVPPPWGYLSAAAGYAIHAGANVQLVEIGVEWLILHGMEKLVTAGPVRKLKVNVLENKLVPALAAHGDYLAGLQKKVAQDRPKSESGVVNEAVRDTLSHLEKVYNVEAIVYPTANTLPGIASLRLPIEAEPAPSLKPPVTRRNEPEWGDDELVFDDKDDQMEKIEDEMKDKKKKIKRRIEELEKNVADLKELDAKVEELKKRKGVTSTEQTKFDQEKKEIADDITEREQLIADRKAELAKLEAQEKQLKDTVASLQQAEPGSGNISMEPDHLAASLMNQKEERYTQWVRATYPYVNAFRAPILKVFDKWLDRSDADKHFKKWTDRYTLTNAWQFRSGYRFKRDSDKKGHWAKDSNFEPLRMYVMDDSFKKKKDDFDVIRTGRRDNKGHEPWTLATDEGKTQAEEKFTIVAVTQRKIEPLFSPVIYPVANKRGITTFAQAIFYNGNEQQPADFGAKSLTQAKLGWDTLNWSPTATVPEWGAPAAVSDKAKWPWEIFDADEELAKNAAVKLNWQAKLMPVRRSRLAPAAAAALLKSTDMGTNAGLTLPLFDKLVTH
jgi:Putative Flp pilus-assembly TadE/G-like